MPATDGRKRMQPRMSRGSWTFGAWSAAGQAVCSSLLALNKLWPDDGLDVLSFWIYTAWFAVSVVAIPVSAPGPEERRTFLGPGRSPPGRLGPSGQAAVVLPTGGGAS